MEREEENNNPLDVIIDNSEIKKIDKFLQQNIFYYNDFILSKNIITVFYSQIVDSNKFRKLKDSIKWNFEQENLNNNDKEIIIDRFFTNFVIEKNEINIIEFANKIIIDSLNKIQITIFENLSTQFFLACMNELNFQENILIFQNKLNNFLNIEFFENELELENDCFKTFKKKIKKNQDEFISKIKKKSEEYLQFCNYNIKLNDKNFENFLLEKGKIF